MQLSTIVKGNTARFSFYRQGYIYYDIDVKGQRYYFPIEIADLGTATLQKEEKAITLMRYIRKALDAGAFCKGGK